MKAVFIWLFSVNLLFCMPDGYFAKEEKISSKKDELILYDVNGKNLNFRWTLYINSGLVMHYSYDKFPYQNVLYTDYKQNTFKIKIKRKFDNHMEPPYFMIVFEKMNEKEKKADFSVYLYNPDKSIKLKRK